LVGKGLTNREIADTLFVSPRTISTHLTHIYQKLDTDDRDELSTLLPTAVSFTAWKAQRGTTEIRADGGDIGSDT
jgi:hypothetical protein